LTNIETMTGGERRSTAASSVYEVLHAEIVGIKLPPGMPLNEKKLVERFGTSRTPVREALIRLVEDGLVEIRPRSATRVARMDMAAISDAVIVRQALEGVTVENAARNAGASDIKLLDKILAEQRVFVGQEAMQSFDDADEALHEAIAYIAGLPGVWAYMRPARAQIARPRRLSLPAFGRARTALEEHGRIRDAIAANDVPSAGAIMRLHLDALLPDLQVLREHRPDYFS
jgi:DNA-binding GntR family transcriptional regulator